MMMMENKNNIVHQNMENNNESSEILSGSESESETGIENIMPQFNKKQLEFIRYYTSKEEREKLREEKKQQILAQNELLKSLSKKKKGLASKNSKLPEINFQKSKPGPKSAGYNKHYSEVEIKALKNQKEIKNYFEKLNKPERQIKNFEKYKKSIEEKQQHKEIEKFPNNTSNTVNGCKLISWFDVDLDEIEEHYKFFEKLLEEDYEKEHGINKDVILEFKNKYNIPEVESRNLNVDYVITLLKAFNKSVGNSLYLGKKISVINRTLMNAMIAGIRKESDFDRILINLTGDNKANMKEYLGALNYINNLEYNNYIKYLNQVYYHEGINREYNKYLEKVNQLNYMNQKEYENYVRRCYNLIM